MTGDDVRAGMAHRGDEAAPSVADVVRLRWGVDLPRDGLPARFAEPGWTYQEQVPPPCPHCAEPLHALRRPYDCAGHRYRYTALVCPGCPRALTLADLGVRTYEEMAGRAPGQVVVPKPRTSDRSVPASGGGGPRRPAWPADLPTLSEDEPRALYWAKVTDPGWRPASQAVAAAEDVRVIMPDGAAFEALRGHLTELGVPYRAVRYWQEAEQIGTVGDLGGRTALVAQPVRGSGERAAPVPGPGAHAARDAFSAQWGALDDVPGDAQDAYTRTTELVPEGWTDLLPHPAFNPAQTVAVPAVLDEPGHVVVVAPTGAGKTPIGMVSALRAHAQGRKAAWLVPQRSLTDELGVAGSRDEGGAADR